MFHWEQSKQNEKPKERWNARPNFQNKFHGDRRTDRELTKNFTFSNFFEILGAYVTLSVDYEFIKNFR